MQALALVLERDHSGRAHAASFEADDVVRSTCCAPEVVTDRSTLMGADLRRRRRDQSSAMGSIFRSLALAAVLVLVQGAGLLQAKKTKDATVIIIGAGMSGISAGKRLAEKGVTDILYLEAREEIGGRVQAHDFNGILVEKGANWIEGVGGEAVNPLIPLAEEINLINTYSNFDNTTSNIYDANGFVDPKIGVPAATAIEDLYGYTETLGVTLTKSKEEDVSVLSAQRFFNHVPKSPLEMVTDYFLNDFEFAEPPRVTSLKSTQPLPTFANYGEEVNFVHDPRGFVAIVHHLAHSFLQHKDGKITDPRLKLNKVVRKVDYHKTGVRVTTEDGAVYTADYAIVSVSLGVLQSQLIDFVPDLPFWKLKSIYSFDMAIYTKIFLKFPSRFWDLNPGAKFWLYADERRGYYPIWENLDSEFPGENVLLVTVTDDESRRVEQQSDSETLAEILVVLRTMFGKDIPTADSIYVPRWYTDRLFRGSFSNWPIGVDSNVFEQLQAPVKTVYFTGEHTSEDYNGYVHGAYSQGIETSNSLLECILHHKCAKPSSVYKKLSKECNHHLDEERDRQKKAWLKIIAKLKKEVAEAKEGHC